MNEWGFAAEIKSWWDREISDHAEWTLRGCRVEETVPGSRDRSDLLVYGDRPLLCGELRLPDHSLPSPWHPDNLLDAVNKATTHGSRWAFTSDSNVLLLIDTHLTGPLVTRIVQRVDLVAFQSRAELDSSVFLAAVKEAWTDAIRTVAPTICGLAVPPGMAADELFINSLRALLSAPVAAIREELNRKRLADQSFEQELVTWMVDDQGWAHLPENWEAEVFRAAQLTVYVFTTRLLFYEALRRSQPALAPLDLPDASARVARGTFRGYFEEAQLKSGDYETLFRWDKVSEFALLADASVPGWLRVVHHLAVFDLNHIGYDILGRIFERLIDPHERYQWGQHYTNPDVVDLMLSFGIPDGAGSVLDPAAGGGTFLVRAYVRKRAYQLGKTHEEILKELFGLDISAFATSLATVNLAVRQLEFADNYPQIATKSFFEVDPSKTFMALPAPKRQGLGDVSSAPVSIDSVRAVVCNPPYVRLHELGDARQREAKRILGTVHGRLRLPAQLHGLSNYHVYFWLHGAHFLEPRGRLVMIAAGEWMDSDYGAVLQEWLLSNFTLECFIESFAEAWFSEARVGTVVVSARLCDDERERESNLVRFVSLRRELRELYGPSTCEGEHLAHVDALRDRLLALGLGHGESDDFDWSVVQQLHLRELGLARKP